MSAFLPSLIWTLFPLLAFHWSYILFHKCTPHPLSALPALGHRFLQCLASSILFYSLHLWHHYQPSSRQHPYLTRTLTILPPSPHLPKQQPADTEQGRRTSLEKFTRSVVSHLELRLFISQKAHWLAQYQWLFAITTILHSVVAFQTCVSMFVWRDIYYRDVSGCTKVNLWVFPCQIDQKFSP